MGSSVVFTLGQMGGPWNVLSRGAALSGLYFTRILLAALARGEQTSEDDYNISREMLLACARDGGSGKRLNSGCFEGRAYQSRRSMILTLS